MFRINNKTASATPPALPTFQGAPGFFTEGNPVTGEAPTVIPAWWLTMIQEEILAVVEASGIDPDQTNNAQLLPAIRKIISSYQQQAGSVSKDDLSEYLQLGGGILTGDLYLSGGIQGDGSILSKTLYAAISGTKINATFQCGGTSVDTPCGVVRVTDKNGNPSPWYFNAASRAITGPSGNTLPEIAGSGGRIIIQAYTATADNGWSLTFPQAFSATPLSIIVNALESDWDAAAQLGTWSATGFTMTNYSTNTANRPQKISVIAIGQG